MRNGDTSQESRIYGTKELWIKKSDGLRDTMR